MFHLSGIERIFSYRSSLESETYDLVGTLVPSGGSNDIEVFVTDANGLTAFAGTGTCAPLYNNGRTFGPVNLDWSIDGRFQENSVYHLVLNNKFAVATPKRVTGRVFLEFDIDSDLR